MALPEGTRLEHYEVIGLLGAGGMGEVYRAVDTKLRREVALKILPPKFAQDPARLSRFEREAHLLASLNHPNIAAIYGLEQQDGIRFLVLELVEGVTLAERMQAGPLSMAEALRIASGIAEALEAAHEKGVLHRDLKPGNVKITPAGKVKVLDFGLAKALGEEEPARTAPLDQPTTLTLQETRAGVVIGTPAYMSPEQAEGKPTDKRSDVWSFGAVLYEMLSGARCFDGKTTSHVIVHVLEQEPDWSKIPASVPANVLHLLQRCLQKDPAERLRDVGDLRLLLQAAAKEGSTRTSAVSRNPPAMAMPPTGPTKKWIWPAIAAALLLIAGGAIAWSFWGRPAAPARATRFQVQLPENVAFSQYVSVSPDGRKLLFNAVGQQNGLWIHDLDTLEWRKLPGTDQGRGPFWSPDSRYLGFSVGNDLKKIEVASGPAQTLCRLAYPPGTGSWSKDNVIVFGTFGGISGPLRRVSASGGVPVDVTVLNAARGETFHALPSFLSDGKHFVYLRQGSDDVSGIYAGSLDAKPSEQSQERILPTRLAAPFVAGYLFFMRENTLMAQPFDQRALKLAGEPVPVVEQVGITNSIGIFSVSPAGVLAYRTGATASAGIFQPTWYDREGKVSGVIGQPVSANGPRISPDGSRLAFRDNPQAGNGDIWIMDISRGVRTRFTFRQKQGSFPVWSPDGKQIIFTAGTVLDTIFEKDASGAGEEKELYKKPGEIKIPSSWSRDGRFLLYHTSNVPKTGSDLWVLPLQGDRKPVLLLGTEFDEGYGTFSPDGRWVAYISKESGRSEVYVRPFVASGPSLGDGKWQVSKDGVDDRALSWTSDGKEIVFGTLNDAPMSVQVKVNGGALEPGVPKQLFDVPAANDWDVSADGKRFLFTVSPGQQNIQAPITVVLNWPADLKR